MSALFMNTVTREEDPSVLYDIPVPVISNPVQSFSSKPLLPPELLQHIFTFLPPSSLKATSLASVAFSQLAQPLLFSTLSISPLQILFYASEPVFRPRWYSEYVRARLQIYILNDKLRCAVRHVRVSPYRIDSQSDGRRSFSTTVAPELIIEALIAALPSFPNVDTLSWHCIDILPNWWSSITQLPRLKHLWLNSCTVFPGNVDLAPPYSIETVIDLF
ncbi:hypothetical protein BDQ17DRAFT_783848 [Cyathus striatus]|nr:hypothetical protein BDQ17DRAFT_783848 [Cyathus striatus]